VGDDAAEVKFPAAGGDWRVAVTRGESVSLGDWAGDGILLALDPRGGIFTAAAGFVARSGVKIVESSEEFAGQLRLSADGFAGTFRLEADALLKVKTGGRPGRVQLNGRPTEHFTFQPETGILGLDLPAGESRIEVTHEL
jgi:hypothetical protein